VGDVVEHVGHVQEGHGKSVREVSALLLQDARRAEEGSALSEGSPVVGGLSSVHGLSALASSIGASGKVGGDSEVGGISVSALVGVNLDQVDVSNVDLNSVLSSPGGARADGGNTLLNIAEAKELNNISGVKGRTLSKARVTNVEIGPGEDLGAVADGTHDVQRRLQSVVVEMVVGTADSRGGKTAGSEDVSSHSDVGGTPVSSGRAVAVGGIRGTKEETESHQTLFSVVGLVVVGGIARNNVLSDGVGHPDSVVRVVDVRVGAESAGVGEGGGRGEAVTAAREAASSDGDANAVARSTAGDCAGVGVGVRVEDLGTIVEGVVGLNALPQAAFDKIGLDAHLALPGSVGNVENG
jgi:hypothetical protein